MPWTDDTNNDRLLPGAEEAVRKRKWCGGFVEPAKVGCEKWAAIGDKVFAGST